MPNDAMKSLKHLFASSILILLLWFLTWPSALTKYNEHRDALDLSAWVFLKERVHQVEWRTIFREKDPSQYVLRDAVPVTESPGFKWEDLKAVGTWPVARSYQLSLLPVPFASTTGTGYDEKGLRVRVYRVSASPDRPLPFDQYEVVATETGKAWVIPAGRHRIYRELEADTMKELSAAMKIYARPSRWPYVQFRLAKHGYANHPLYLDSRAPAFEKLTSGADLSASTVRLFGLSLSIGLFLSVTGLVLGGIAFTMLGPVLALARGGQAGVTDPWIIVTPVREGLPGRLVEMSLLAISLVWIAAPLAVLFWQASTQHEIVEMLSTLERVASGVGTLGLVLAASIHLVVSLQFRACRQRRGTELCRSSEAV